MLMASTTNHPLDFAFRVIESVAFALHALLGISEPLTGCLQTVFRDPDNPHLWPVAGCVLALVSWGNFYFDDNIVILLAIQWYIVAFHFGAIWYHIRLGHHPAVGLAPGMFIPIALTVIGIRLQSNPSRWWLCQSYIVLPVGTVACAAVSHVFCRILVKKPPSLGSPNNDDGSSDNQPLLR